MFEARLYNFCPHKTADQVKKVMSVARKTGAKMVAFDDVEDYHTSKQDIRLWCRVGDCNLNCNESNVTTVIKFET